MDDSELRVTCENLSVRYPVGRGRDAAVIDAVDSVHWAVAPSRITAVVGPSGCGKTTLLRVLAGLQRPTSGTVRCQPPAASTAGDIGFVFQQPALLPWRTAIENVLLPLKLISTHTRRDDPRTWRQQAADALRLVDLQDAEHRLPHELSGGMQMRVSIARAMVTRPRLLLMDEPFAALDAMLRAQLGELVHQLWRQHAFTAVIVTHNIGEAVLLSHQIVVMRRGRCDDPIDNPLAWPRSQRVRRTPEFGELYGRVTDALDRPPHRMGVAS